jgi:hypothetical protein
MHFSNLYWFMGRLSKAAANKTGNVRMLEAGTSFIDKLAAHAK